MDRLLATAISEPVGDCAWTKSHTATDTKRYGTRPDLAILKNSDRRDGQKFGQLSRRQSTLGARDLIGQTFRKMATGV
jgi:hypothetical protein